MLFCSYVLVITLVDMSCMKAYSEDLKWRAVWLALVRGMNSTEIGHVLFMCEASVHRYSLNYS